MKLILLGVLLFTVGCMSKSKDVVVTFHNNSIMVPKGVRAVYVTDGKELHAYAVDTMKPVQGGASIESMLSSTLEAVGKIPLSMGILVH